MVSPIRLLIVDDSPLFVEALQEVLAVDADVQVVGTAADGPRALRLNEELRPDIITMDIHLPGMSGLDAVEQIMRSHPAPILILTGDPGFRDASRAFEALSLGALEIMVKPELIDPEGDGARGVRDRIHFLAGVPVVHHIGRRRHRRLVEHRRTPSAPPNQGGIVGLVASTGGPSLIADGIAALPSDFPLAILIVQHLAPGFAPHFAEWLGSDSKLNVALAEHAARAIPGHVYLAPDGHHLTVDRRGNLHLDKRTPPVNGHLPSGDLLLRSIAGSYGPRSVGVILSGMGRDGVEGLSRIYRAGGVTLAQERSSCVIDGMPGAALDAGVVSREVPAGRLSTMLVDAAAIVVERATHRHPSRGDGR